MLEVHNWQSVPRNLYMQQFTYQYEYHIWLFCKMIRQEQKKVIQ